MVGHEAGHGHKRQVTHSFQPAHHFVHPVHPALHSNAHSVQAAHHGVHTVHPVHHIVHPLHHSVQPAHHGAHHSVHTAHTVQAVHAPAVPAPAPLPTLAELVATHPKLTTLYAAVQAAGLAEVLAGEGPFTVFAPTDQAFAKVPAAALASLLEDKEALAAVLTRHVVPGAALRGKDVPPGATQLATAGGEEVTVARDKFIQVRSSAGQAYV